MSKRTDSLKVAIVVDSLAMPGGADRMVFSILSIFPTAKIYTTVYFRENYKHDRWKFQNSIETSFIQDIPFSRRFYRHLNILSPVAIEGFDLDGVDLVISLSAGVAKGVITGLKQPHIGIILTPPRSLWDHEDNFRGSILARAYRSVSPFVKTYLRLWDQSAIKRVDRLISISKYIQNKVQHVYHRDSSVIYPGISKYWFDTGNAKIPTSINEQFYLVVSRLYDYKRVDMAIRAANEEDRRLLIVGDGPERERLKRLAGSRVEMLGWQPDEVVRDLYKNADALLFCGVEDFGYVPVEAMASGCPVLAYNEGGVTETVVSGQTGYFFNDQNELNELVRNIGYRNRMDQKRIVARAKEYTEERFLERLVDFIKESIDEI